MFDIAWSELLVIGIVALVVVGPKELPVLLRTIGRYMGMIKRQAGEFRAQFDEAMREAELDQLKKEVETLKSDAESSMRDVERSVSTEFDDAKRELDRAAEPGAATATVEPPYADNPSLVEGPRPAEPSAAATPDAEPRQVASADSSSAQPDRQSATPHSGSNGAAHGSATVSHVNGSGGHGSIEQPAKPGA